MRHPTSIIVLLFSALIFTGCNKETDFATPPDEAPSSELAASPFSSSGSYKKSPAIWADCEAFATNGTNANFKPTAGNFDELYNGANFMDGLGAVSESKPGDQDYNGGRWHVNTLKAGVDPNKYNSVCSVEDIDLADFESTDTYFECPLRPVRGNSGAE